MQQGIETGMVVADARAIFPSIKILDDDPKLAEKLLKSIAKWCIRYTDVVAIDLPEWINPGCFRMRPSLGRRKKLYQRHQYPIDESGV